MSTMRSTPVPANLPVPRWVPAYRRGSADRIPAARTGSNQNNVPGTGRQNLICLLLHCQNVRRFPFSGACKQSVYDIDYRKTDAHVQRQSLLDCTDRTVHENTLDGARQTPGMVHGKTLEMVQNLRTQLYGASPEAFPEEGLSPGR